MTATCVFVSCFLKGTTALILMQQFLFTFRLLLQVLILHRPPAPWVDTNPPRVLQAACHVWLATIRHWWDLKTVRVALRVVIKPPLVRLAVHIAEAVNTQRAVQAHAAIAEAVHTQRAARAHVSVAEVVHTRLAVQAHVAIAQLENTQPLSHHRARAA